MIQRSEIDQQKEKHEEEVFFRAIQLSRHKKKLTRDILSFLDGEVITRNKNDKPDIIVKARKTKENGQTTLIGIEHFLVEQVSEKRGNRCGSVVEKNRNHMKGIIEKYQSDKNNQELLQKSKERLLQTGFDTAAKATRSGIPELRQAFHRTFINHLSKVDDYWVNLHKIANGKDANLVFLIEIHSLADDIFLNNGKTLIRRHNDIYPLFCWMIKELETIDPKKIRYVIIYQRDSINKAIEDIVAIETQDIQGSLRKQGIIVYDYCDDPGQINIKTLGLSQRGLEYTIQVSNEETFGRDILPILQKAYEYKKRSIPFVASRCVQAMMHSFGKVSFSNKSSGCTLLSEYPREEALRRYDEFVAKFPVVE